MADQYADLEDAVSKMVKRENNKEHIPYDHELVVEVNEYTDGPALDIWRDEDGKRVVPDKVHRSILTPAHRTGWVPTATVRTELSNKVRVFLRPAEDVMDVGSDNDTADPQEMFAAGLFYAALLMTDDHTDEWKAFFENGGVQG